MQPSGNYKTLYVCLAALAFLFPILHSAKEIQNMSVDCFLCKKALVINDLQGQVPVDRRPCPCSWMSLPAKSAFQNHGLHKNNCTKPSPALIAGFCAPSSARLMSDEINLQGKLFVCIVFCAEHSAFKQSWFPSFIFLAWNGTSCMSNQFSPSERGADEKRHKAIQCVKHAYYNLIKEKQQGRDRHRTVAPRALVSCQAIWNKYNIRNSIGVQCA